ncbi:hypothetical protein [Calothrix sp. FACHB-168]|uniref:hypothetical protein n=1 Tax=Calothrix sp. FACHB-168 TaxID=2692780 RepID=UPI0030D9EE01
MYSGIAMNFTSFVIYVYLLYQSSIIVGHWALGIGHWALGIGHWAWEREILMFSGVCGS